MSHDRGCFKCHEDPSEYANCKRAGCPKRERYAVEPGGDKSDAPPRPQGPFVGDPGYRSGGDDEAKRRDASIAEHRRLHKGGVVEVCGELREHDGRALGRRITQADLDGATPLPPLGDSRRERVTQIITVTEPGYDVVLFFNEDGGAEAVISRPNDKPTGVNIAPPGPGRRIVVERTGDRFAVVYRNTPHG